MISTTTCYFNLSELEFQLKKNRQRGKNEVKFTDQLVGWGCVVHKGIPFVVFGRNNKRKRHILITIGQVAHTQVLPRGSKHRVYDPRFSRMRSHAPEQLT